MLTGPGERPAGAALLLLIALWFVVLFDPQWLLAAYGVGVFLKLRLILFIALTAALLLGGMRRWNLYWPFLMFVCVTAVTVPFALNNGLARESLIQLALFWTLIIATAGLVDSVRRAELLLVLYGAQFLWWSVWGATSGQVAWHHTLANYDGYGAFMVGGLGLCYFLAIGAPPGWFRKAMYVTAGLAALGVVATMARGAFLAAIALFGIIWLRSPRKGPTSVAGIAGLIIITVASSVLHPEDSFWAEIMSVFEEGTSSGTGEDRWELWKAGVLVWEEHPLLGVGARNFGVFAAGYFQPGDLGGLYANNPAVLYNRSLHSMYVQTLSEHGIIGILTLLWILIDFWRRNAVLRGEAAARRWQELGGRMKLRCIALGLEACMVAFLVTAAFYALTGVHWFYTLLGLNLLLHCLVQRQPEARRRMASRPRAAGAPVTLAAPAPFPSPLPESGT